MLIAGGTLLTAYCTALAVGCAAAMFPGELDVPAYLVVNAGLLCLHLALGGFCFFASCLFNESRLSVALGAGVPVLFFLIRMLANMGGRLEKLKYATVCSPCLTPPAFSAATAPRTQARPCCWRWGLVFTRWARPCSAGGTCRCNA